MMKINRLKSFFFFTLAKLPMKGQKRCKFVRWGVDCVDDNSFIGEDVLFDTLYPQNIHLGRRVHITARVVILTHYLDTSCNGVHWQRGHVYVGDGTFIGTGSIVSVRILDKGWF